MSSPDSNIEVRTLIPQREPILMVSSFETADGDAFCCTTLTVSRDMALVDDEAFLTQEGLLEHIAQSAAALMGYRRLQRGLPVTLGFIGDIKQCSFGEGRACVGEVLHTELQIVQEIGNIIMIKAATLLQGRLLVQCSMKLANA